MKQPTTLEEFKLMEKEFEVKRFKQEMHIETPWDWCGWLQARIPNLEPKHKFWVEQCVKDLVGIKLKQMAPSDEEVDNLYPITTGNNKELPANYFKREGAKDIRDYFINNKK